MGVFFGLVAILLKKKQLWERGQARSFPGYWVKGVLIWEEGFVFVFLEKMISVYTPSRVIWIRYDKGRPPEN